jgi:hypothetical protein
MIFLENLLYARIKAIIYFYFSGISQRHLERSQSIEVGARGNGEQQDKEAS